MGAARAALWTAGRRQGRWGIAAVIVGVLLATGGLLGVAWSTFGRAVPSPAAADPQPRLAHACDVSPPALSTRLDELREGEQRRVCAWPLLDPDRPDLWVTVWQTRLGEGEGSSLAVSIVAEGRTPEPQTLWSRTEERARGLREAFASVRSFVPFGEPRAHLVYALGIATNRCGGAYIGAVAMIDRRPQEVLQAVAGCPADVVAVGRQLVVTSTDAYPSDLAGYGAVRFETRSLYEWTGRVYRLVDSVKVPTVRLGVALVQPDAAAP